MAESFYFSHDSTEFGPFSATEMRGMAVSGRICPTDPVWKEGTGQKVLAERVKNLFPMPSPDAALPAREEASAASAAPAAPQSAPLIGHATPSVDSEERMADAAEVARLPEPFTPARERAPARATQRTDEPQARPKRVVSIRGGTLTGQDGARVQFRKKCETCGHEDNCRSSAVIRLGSFQVPFFCPKCRRGRTVQMTAVN